MSNIADVILHCQIEHPGADPAVLIEHLIDREQGIADVLRVTALDFGLYPEIVAEMFVQVDLGGPYDQEQREFVHHNYQALIQRMQGTNPQEG